MSRAVWTAVALYAAVLAVWFWPMLAGDQLGQSYVLWDVHPWVAERPPGLEVSQHSGQGDVALNMFPLVELARDQLLAGHVPLWNPHSAGGMPLLGDMQTALLFPLTWLALAIGPAAAWGPIAFLKLLAAGTGAWALTRRLGIGPGGALLGGLVYMLCAPNVVWVQHPHGTVFVLLPWLLLAVDRLYRHPDARAVAWLGIAVALTLLAGHPETALFALAAAGLYGLALAAFDRGLTWRRAGIAVAGLALGVAISAAALLPFAAALADSDSVGAHGDVAELTLPASAAITLLVPSIYGDGQPDYAGPLLYYQAVAGYTGLLALGLALVGLLRFRLTATARALALVGAVALLAAFGVPPVSWLLSALPLFSVASPTRLFFVFALVVAIGAAAGFHSLRREPVRAQWVLAVAGAAALLVLAWVAWIWDRSLAPVPRETSLEALGHFGLALIAVTGLVIALGRSGRRRLLLVAALGIVLADLAFLRGYNVFLPPEQAHPGETPAIRAITEASPTRLGLVRPSGPPIYPPSRPVIDEVPTVAGRDHPPPRRWWRLAREVLDYEGPPSRPDILVSYPPPAGAGLTAHRMLATDLWATAPGVPRPNPDFEIVHRGPDLTVYRDPAALPRAYLVGSAIPATEDEALAAMRDAAWEPARLAFAEGITDPVTGGSRREEVRVEQRSPTHVRLHLPPGARGWLVLSDSYSPGWRATAGGESVPVRPTNVAVMGLEVPEGARTIDLRLSRASFRWGMAISGLGLMGALALALRGRRRHGGAAGPARD